MRPHLPPASRPRPHIRALSIAARSTADARVAAATAYYERAWSAPDYSLMATLLSSAHIQRDAVWQAGVETVGADAMVRGARHMRRVYPGGTTFAVQRAAPCPDGAVLVHWTFEGRRKGGAVDEGAGCSVFEFEEEDSDAPTPRIAATTVFRTALRAEVDLAVKTAAGEVPQGALLRGGGDSG